MTKKLEKPDWYNEAFYNKERTPEEWLYEIWKRNQLNQDNVAPFSIRIMSPEQKKKIFLDFIFLNDMQRSLDNLQPTPAQPVKPLTVSDVFCMASMIANSEWYKNHPDKVVFEGAVTAIRDGKPLSSEQNTVFDKFHHTPWHAFQEKSQDESWHPIKNITYLSGVPVSIDPSYQQEGILKQLKTCLKEWVGKLHSIETKFHLWQEYKILAIFDLMLWYKLQDTEYSNIGLHELLWPKGRLSPRTDEFVNPNDDIDHSIKLVHNTINPYMVRTLTILCKNRKYKKQLENK